MNNIIAELIQFAQTPICAVYFSSKNGLSNLAFHYLTMHKNKLVITDRILNDDKFFHQLYKKNNISKNQFLAYIHKNIKKEKYIHLDSNIDIIITHVII